MKSVFLSKLAIVPVLLAPMFAGAQVTALFSDGFAGAGVSTLNPTAASPGSLSATATAYEMASSKNASTTTLANGVFKLSTAATSSGYTEAQALFTASPVTLNTPGQYLEIFYTFTNTANIFNGFANNAEQLTVGLYNSGGSAPTNGALLWNGGLASGSSTAVNGGCKGWLGYDAAFAFSSNGIQSSAIGSRPAQTGANNLNQAIGYNSGYAGGANITTMPGVVGQPTLTPGTAYTIDLKITYVNATTIAITNMLLNGAGNGGTVFSAGGWTGKFGAQVTSPLTMTFDALQMGIRPNGSVATAYTITNVTVLLVTPIAPGITGLTNQTVVSGSSTMLTSSVSGVPAPGLQWYLSTDGGATSNGIIGATGSSLALNNVQFAQNNNVYYLVATNSLGAASSSMNLTVTVPPGITGLSDQSHTVGDTVTISPVISGVPAPALQWRRNGSDLADGSTGNGSTISGSTSGTLTITSAQAADSGAYSLVASNSAGMVTNGMTLLVASGAVAPTITGLTNQSVLAGNSATLSASVAGAPIPDVQWYVSTDGGATSNAIAGATSASLTLTNVQYAQNGYVYLLTASNSAGVLTSNLTLTVVQIAPVIAGLTNQTVDARFNATLSASVSGAPAPVLQWQLNGAPITGATNTTLTLTNVQLAQSGYVYALTATNSAGTATTSMTLTVTNALFNVQLNGLGTYSGAGQIGAAGDVWNNPALANFDNSGASHLTSTVIVSGYGLTDSRGAVSPVTLSLTGANYKSYLNPSSGHGEVVGLNSQSLKFDYTGSGTPSGSITLTGLPPNASLNLFGYGTTVYSSPDGSAWTFAAANGGAVGNQTCTNSTGGMDLTQATNQGSCWIKLVGTTDSSGNLTVNLAPQNISGGVWWQFYLSGFQLQLHTPPQVAGLTNLTVVQGNSTLLAPTVTGLPAPACQWQVNGASIPGETNGTLSLNNVQYSQNGNVYSLVSTNLAGVVTNSMTLTVIVTPSIADLNNQTAAPGDTVVISPTVSGVPAPALQWLYNGTPLTDGVTGNGSTIAGSTSSTLSITSAQTADSGAYSLVASNLAGIVTNSMNLTVSAGAVAPNITGPVDQTVVQGNDATFTASVSGLPAPDLQWLENGAPISGATSSTLTLNNVQYSQNNNTYSLVASNSAGSVTNSATLTVWVAVNISAQPGNLTVTNTQSASFTVGAAGVPAPGYQWYYNGGIIPAATATTYTIGSAAPTNMGSYFVVISNSVNVITSSVVTLTVNSTMDYTSLTPANGASGVCYDTPLYLNFTVAPVLRAPGTIKIYNANNSSTPVDTLDLSLNTSVSAYAINLQPRNIGGATFSNMPVIITGNTAAIYPHLGVLTSNQTYYVTLDDGVFADASGAYFAGISGANTWRFTTKVGGPANPTNLVVAADGSGDFATVQGAVDSVPANNTTPTRINIRNGTYMEIVNISSRHNLDLRGQSRTGAVVGYPNNNWANPGAPLRSCFVLNANDCTLENLTLTNMTPSGGSQAEAVDVEGTRAIFYNMELDSYQDTFLVHSAGKLVYFQDSLVQGQTDFNWGYGTVYYTNCELRCRLSGGHVTQPRSPYTTNGFGFINCRITQGYSGSSTFDLGRTISTPSTPSEVLFYNCLMADVVPGYASDAGTNMADYSCSNLTATATKTLASSTHAPSNDPFVTAIQRASTWLYGWQPQAAPYVISQPGNKTVTNGQSAAFTVNVTAIPLPAYQWFKNGANLPGATGATLNIGSAQRSDGGAYYVVASNGSGSVTSSVVTLTYNNTAPIAQDFTLGAVVGLTISTPIIGGLYAPTDADNDALTVTGVTAGTNGIVSTDGTSLSYVATNGPVDTFTYTVSDGFGGTAIGTVRVEINSNAQSYNLLSVTSSANGTNTLAFAGIPTVNYALDMTTNLLPPIIWVPQVTNAAANDGSLIFTNISLEPQSFYRTRQVP